MSTILFNLYILVMSLLPLGIPGSLGPSVRMKTHFPTLPMDVWYLVGTVLTKEIDPWKKIPLCARRPPAARKNAFSHYISHLPMPIGSRATRGFLRYVEYEFFRTQDRQNHNIDAVFCRITSGWRAKRASREYYLNSKSYLRKINMFTTLHTYCIFFFSFDPSKTFLSKCEYSWGIRLAASGYCLIKGNFVRKFL